MTFVKRRERIDGRLVTVHRIDGLKVSAQKFAAEMRRAQAAHQKPPKAGRGTTRKGGAWPMKSIALAVHKKQIGEAIESAKRKGVPTDFAPDGRPIFTSRKHYADYCKAYRFFNRDAGFGDAAPREK